MTLYEKVAKVESKVIKIDKARSSLSSWGTHIPKIWLNPQLKHLLYQHSYVIRQNLAQHFVHLCCWILAFQSPPLSPFQHRETPAFVLAFNLS